MPFEYESLVGYLVVVGGRSISQPPPGALVEMSPRRAARGREADTFYALTMPSGATPAAADFYAGLARDAAAHYFDGSGSVTSGIRAALMMLNERLHEQNLREGRTLEAAMICGVLRGSDLFVGRVGGGLILLQKAGITQVFPADPEDDDQLYTPPLGVQPIPDVRMTRYTVTANTRLVFADPALLEQPLDETRAALGAEDIGAALAALREKVKRTVTLMLIEMTPPLTQPSYPARVGESSSAIRSGEAAGVATDPPPKSAAADKPTPVIVPRAARRDNPFKALGSGLAKRAARVVKLVSHLFERLIPVPKEGERSWLSSPAAAGVAVLLPVLLVAGVILLWVSGTGESEFDSCVDRSLTAADTARTIASGDLTGVVAAWNAVILVVDECSALREEPDAALDALWSEARSVLDRLQNIARRAQTPIYAFPNAQLTDVVLQGDDMYVLDSNNQQVYRVALTEDGLGVLAGSYEPIPAMRRGGRVINFDVGTLVDIAWADNGAGLPASNVITALDENGLLIACPPRFLQDCAAQQLPGVETWESPKTMQYWEGRLYVLDPGGNQIWRYDPSGGSFGSVPLEYFAGVTRPDITSAVDFAITSVGDIYLLLNTGVVARFRAGEQQDFAFTFPTTQTLTSPRAMYMNTNPIAQGLFFVEQETRTIYETTMAGTFISAYRADDETLYNSLNDLVVDSNLGLVYALSGNSIFAFRRDG
ncbi:MAG: hypothetical protein JNL42_11695 [Anaerolineae bacterium]|nr:hypothetical protein [Anaerolineae bacterium]